MRKLNTHRMLKNIARNTPDRQVVRIDPMNVIDPHNIYRGAGYRFERMMFLKYGERNVDVTIYRDDELGTYPGEIVYTFVARKR